MGYYSHVVAEPYGGQVPPGSYVILVGKVLVAVKQLLCRLPNCDSQ